MKLMKRDRVESPVIVENPATTLQLASITRPHSDATSSAQMSFNDLLKESLGDFAKNLDTGQGR